jgi:uncharacterized protein (TIGR02466 family)
MHWVILFSILFSSTVWCFDAPLDAVPNQTAYADHLLPSLEATTAPDWWLAFEPARPAVESWWPTTIYTVSSLSAPALQSLEAALRTDAQTVLVERYVGGQLVSPRFCGTTVDAWCALLIAGQADTVHISDPRAGAGFATFANWRLSHTRRSFDLTTHALLLFPAHLRFFLETTASPRNATIYQLSASWANEVVASLTLAGATVDTFSCWPTEIYRAHLPAAARLAALANFTRHIERHEQPRPVVKSNRGGYQTRADFFQRYAQHPALANLVGALLGEITTYLQFTRSSPAREPVAIADIHQSWVGINRQGHENVVHLHPQNMISGVLYLEIPDTEAAQPPTGQICFLDPRARLSSLSTRPLQHCLSPTPGLLLLFPSWLEHYVRFIFDVYFYSVQLVVVHE